jgi:hypothetical protein
MADPKSRKLRGFGAKTGAQLELLLNQRGLRVDFKETQGLFSKTAWLKRYLLIWAVRSGLDGSDAFQFGRSDLNGGGPDGPICTGKRKVRSDRCRSNGGGTHRRPCSAAEHGSRLAGFHRERCSGGQINRILG